MVFSRQLLLDVFQPGLGEAGDITPLARSPDRAGRCRGGSGMELHQLLDLFQSETQFLTLPDKANAFEIAVAVRAVAGRVSRRFPQDSSPLIEADGLNIHPGSLRQLADPHDFIVNLIPGYRVNL